MHQQHKVTVLSWYCRHVCPYHASRDVLNEGAALVFLTYSQLLDPPVRSANGLDDLIKGAVLVFDEVLPALLPMMLANAVKAGILLSDCCSQSYDFRWSSHFQLLG